MFIRLRVNRKYSSQRRRISRPPKTTLWSACFRASTPHFILILGGELQLWHTGRARVCLPGGICEETATAAESCEADRTDAVRGAASREDRRWGSGHDRPGLSP